MTLRCTIEIVPYGQEDMKQELFKLDISNIEEVENQGFGHVLCKYNVKQYRYNNETMRRVMKTDEEWELEREFEIPVHNRRDGAISLVEKAVTFIEHGDE